MLKDWSRGKSEKYHKNVIKLILRTMAKNDSDNDPTIGGIYRTLIRVLPIPIY